MNGIENQSKSAVKIDAEVATKSSCIVPLSPRLRRERRQKKSRRSGNNE
jgi:hypothetical protein